MTSIKLKFCQAAEAGKEGSICYQIIHERKMCSYVTGFKVFPGEWDEKRSMLVTDIKSKRYNLLLSMRESILDDIERIKRIVGKLDSRGIPFSVNDIYDEFVRFINECTLFTFMNQIIENLRRNGKIRTSETYQTTLSSFMKFRNGEDLRLDRITTEEMEKYEAWHRKRGVVPNTTSFYMRVLRAVYNRAVEKGLIENRKPFKRVYTGVDKTVKRALPLSVIHKIKSVDLSGFSEKIGFARDMFLLSFYLRGMSFIDMAFLKKSDLKRGYVIYRRRKTGQQLIVKWTKEMQLILDRYPENTTNYLFPIITETAQEERKLYRNAAGIINNNLKLLAEIVGVNMPLTMYVARHSWASAAKSKGIPVSVISEGMGHDSEATTKIYLASLDTSLVDKANSLILSSI